MNEGLFTAYRSLPGGNGLTRLKNGDCTALSEIAEGERPFLAAALAHKTGRPVVLVSPSELVAQKQSQDIDRLVGGGSAVLPAPRYPVQPRRHEPRKHLAAAQRAGSAGAGQGEGAVRQRGCAFGPLRAAARFKKAIVTVAEGERHAPDQLIRELMENSYERVAMVEGRGQCAMRSSILDVFRPPDAVPSSFSTSGQPAPLRLHRQRSIARIKIPSTSPLPPSASSRTPKRQPIV